MKWLCSVGVAVGLALQPALAEDTSANHPLTPEARDAYVTDLLKKMTVDEKIGQLRLISVGPDNPKEAIRDMIKASQVTVMKASTNWFFAGCSYGGFCLIWLAGFILYRVLMNIDMLLGNTLPDMVLTIILCMIVAAVRGRKKA